MRPIDLYAGRSGSSATTDEQHSNVDKRLNSNFRRSRTLSATALVNGFDLQEPPIVQIGTSMKYSLLIAVSFMCGAFCVSPCFAAAPTDKKIETAGTIVAISLPMAAVGISLLHHHDWEGIAELTESTALTVGAALILKQVVREQRPDHSDFQSFPSETAALAYSSADYLWDRYGWRYGVPAYAAAMFVGYSRVKSKQHHWYDVAASSVLAFGVNYALVTRYRESSRYQIYASADVDTIGIHFAMNW